MRSGASSCAFSTASAPSTAPAVQIVAVGCLPPIEALWLQLSFCVQIEFAAAFEVDVSIVGLNHSFAVEYPTKFCRRELLTATA
jgi:hypothetical protein